MQKFITDLIRAALSALLFAVGLFCVAIYIGYIAKLLRFGWDFGWQAAERLLQ